MLIKIDGMITSNTSVTFSPEHVLKHSKLGWKLNVFKYQPFSDPQLRTLERIKECIRRKSDRAKKNQRRLFITHRKP